MIGFQYQTHFGTVFHYYLVVHVAGNILVGCPEGLDTKVEEQINRIGGINRIFLTHRHDIGAVAEYKQRYRAAVIMHKSGQEYLPVPIDLAFGDRVVDGGVEFIHTPGHTPENSCLLIPEKGHLFTGDTICVNRRGIPFIYRHKRGTEEMSEAEVARIAETVISLDFTDVYSGVSGGYCLGRAKELLLKQSTISS